MEGHLRASLWCAHPRLKPGESVSSWLHRSAFANGMSNHTFCRHVFGGRAVWNRDVDHVLDHRMLEIVAAATLESADKLEQGSLAAFQGKLFVDAGLRVAHFPWVLSLGVYHRTRHRHGQQFCPRCLQTDAWLRLEWRLAWAICCTEHACYLRDACPACDGPIVFHRMSLAVPGRLNCHLCGANVLREAEDVPAPEATLRFQRSLADAVRKGAARPGGGDAVPALEYFEGLRMLVRGAFNKKALKGLATAFAATERLAKLTCPPMYLERWRLPERIFALEMVRLTLRDWPDGFVHACHRHGIYRSRFEEVRGAAPQWLLRGLNGLDRR